MKPFNRINRKSKTKDSRKNPLSIESLENRELLTAALWVGQSGADYVGPWSQLRPSTIQDIEVRLSDLPSGKEITRAVVQGYGADRWELGGPEGSWLVDKVQAAGSNQASLFFEPARAETGREFSVGLTYTDGTFEEIYFQGGVADPQLKAIGKDLTSVWLGSSAGIDLTTPSATVGPDGVSDFQIRLTNLNQFKTIQAIDLVDANQEWVASYGVNPSRVGTLELSRTSSNASEGVLTFSNPAKPMAGPLTVQVTYQDGTKESSQCPVGELVTSSTLPDSLPAHTKLDDAVVWNGQTVSDSSRPGWARITLNALADNAIVAFQMSDIHGQNWLWTKNGDVSPWPTVDNQKNLVTFKNDQGQWSIEFDSSRNLESQKLTLIAMSSSGVTYQMDFVAGRFDTAKRSMQPESSQITASPGDDLQTLLDTYGTVNLGPGIYQLNQPLVLTKPVNLVGTPDSVIQFSQSVSDPGWSTVLTVSSGNVKLKGFRITFSDSVRWLDNIRYGPAVIGTPDNYSGINPGAISNLVIENLDITGPRPTSFLQESPRLIRMIDSVSGNIRNNTFYGGWVEVTGGPWNIQDNVLNGVWPDSFAYDAFAAHSVNELELSGNIVNRMGDSGVIFRLVVVNGECSDINITGNQAIGLGSSLSDPWQMQQINANEVILTEAYHVAYEGKLLAVDSDRQVIQIGTTLGQDYQPGHVLAVLDGPNAGFWSVVSQVLDKNTLVLDSALPEWVQSGTAVSVSKAIRHLNISDNRIDQIQRPQSLGSVLVGNLFDLRFQNNMISGGFRGIQIIAYPSESPRDWGWTRNVIFDAEISGNQFHDVLWLNQLGVSHSTAARANYGHLYLTASFHDNQFQWSEDFLLNQIRQLPGDSHLFLPGLEAGEGGLWDNHEAQLSIFNNQIDLPTGWANRPAIWFRSGTVNQKPAQGEIILLDPVQKLSQPTGLSLVKDSGVSSSDGLTNDPRLRLDSLPGLTYEYRIGSEGAWLAVSNPSEWSPAGLSDGLTTVFVRALDSMSQPGPESSLTFTLDTISPQPIVAFSQPSYDSVSWQNSGSSDAVIQHVTFRNGSYTQGIELTPDQNQITPVYWVIGNNFVDVAVEDAAGNLSDLATGTFGYDVSGQWGGQDGSDFASLKRSLVSDGKQDVRLDIQGLPYGIQVAGVSVSAFGGGKWAWPSAPAGSYAAYWRLNADQRSGAIYFQTNRVENGRPFNVTIQFSDGSVRNFWVVGGSANPNLKVAKTLLSANRVQQQIPTKTSGAVQKRTSVKIPIRSAQNLGPQRQQLLLARQRRVPVVANRIR